jgi:hypothetical protein
MDQVSGASPFAGEILSARRLPPPDAFRPSLAHRMLRTSARLVRRACDHFAASVAALPPEIW